MYKLIFAILIAIGLSHSVERKPLKTSEVKQVYIDKGLQPYVIEFDHIIYNSGIDINYGSLVLIKFSDRLQDNILGIAWGMNHDVTVIDINRRQFYRLSLQERRLVIFHEMAHDVFNLEHGSIDLMAPTKPKEVTKELVDAYIAELIKHIKNGR
jgi:hypothetical protein